MINAGIVLLEQRTVDIEDESSSAYINGYRSLLLHAGSPSIQRRRTPGTK